MEKKWDHIKRTVQREYYNYRAAKKRDFNIELTAKESKAVAAIEKHGFCVIENFYTEERCAAIRGEIDRLIVDYDDQLWKDKMGADHRIFGADYLSAEVGPFYDDDFIVNVVQTYEKSTDMHGFTMGAKLEYLPGNLGSGQGWHRDSVQVKQTKAIIYLNDVEASTGPFQYIEGSHTALSLVKEVMKSDLKHDQDRLDDEVVQKIIDRDPKKLIEFTGKAGTLILVDTRGIHRGKPIEAGKRYALTNYLWFNMPIPKHVQRLMIEPTETE